jgi:hypothetical protein
MFGGAMIPAAAEGFICGGDPSAGDSARCLPQLPWGLLEDLPSPKPITKVVLF